MNRGRNVLGIILGIGIILLLTFVMVSVIRGALPRAADSRTGAEQTQGTDYPPPGETNTPPAPSLNRTDVFPWDLPTRPPYPITPAPTLTLVPGPSPTPIPLIQPAKDYAGEIFFFANEMGNSKSNFFSMSIDSMGKLNQETLKIFESDPFTDQTLYFSPDGMHLAIIDGWGAVRIFNLEKGNFEETSLPPASGNSIFYAWFPDNRRILWSSGGLELTDPFSGEHSDLAVPGYGHVTAAAASPDGRFVVYAISTDIIYPRGLWIINTNGQGSHLLVKEIDPKNISWSPDGNQIAFYASGWKVVDADGSNLRDLAKGIFLPQCYFLPAIWSPDSRTLAVVTSQSGQAFCKGWSENLFKDTNIVLIDVESGEAWPLLSDGSMGNIDPAWSPDGTQLVFVSNRSGSPEIWVVNKDGTNLRQMTNDHLMVRYPFWQAVDR